MDHSEGSKTGLVPLSRNPALDSFDEGVFGQSQLLSGS